MPRRIALSLALASTLALAGDPTTGSVVLFNTVCARCHELECSRRLSFPSASPAADARGHIENYAGAEGAAMVGDLVGLLDYTKTQCDYYAPDVPIPADRVWPAAALAPLATRDRRSWFLPLGELPAATLRLSLELSGEQPIEIEVLSRAGVAAEAVAAPGSRRAQVIFRAEAPGLPHFLRLRSRAPIALSGAALEEAPAGEPSR